LTLRSKIEIIAGILAIVALAVVASSYVSSKRDAEKLKAAIAIQEKVIGDASARETARDATLKTAIDSIEELKKRTQTPAQVIRALPSVLPLPVPITISTPAPAKPGEPPIDLSSLPATLPAADIKPLFDFAANCQECQKKLEAAAADHADDQTKMGALTKERDELRTAAKGGTVWTRIKKRAKTFAVDAAIVGGIAAVAVLKK